VIAPREKPAKTKPSTHTDTDPSNGSLIARMLTLGWRYRWPCVKVLIWQVVVVVMSLSSLSLTGLGIDVIRHAVTPGSAPPHYRFGIRPPDDWSAMRVVAVIAAVGLAVAILQAAIRYYATMSEARLMQKLIIDLRSQVYDKLQRLSFRFFDANESASIINRVTADVQSVRMFIDSVLIEVLQLVLAVGFYMAYMLNVHVRLTFACLATLPLLWVGAAIFASIVRPAHQRTRELLDRMLLRLSENIQGIQVVKGFAREQQEIDRFHRANDDLCEQQRWIFRCVSTFVPIVNYLTHLNLAILLGYGGYLVIQDQLLLGEGLIVFAGILQQLSTRVSSISMITNSIQRSLTGAARVFEVLDTPIEIQSPPDAPTLNDPRGQVRFEHVSFAYRDGEPVLRDVGVTIDPGQRVAIVGPNGAGKSTLLSLIPRFYDATTGRVLIDGHDVRDLDIDSLRRNIGVVFQESFLFSNTVAANIAFGHPEATHEQVERAARIASAHDFITELRDGYGTIIGENGVDLSGGQRQRLAIARAVLLEPRILLLDDPTAAVDPHTEHEILAAMDNAMRGRTTLMIAHRLSTLRLADWVIVLDEGRVAQIGTHEQLMRLSGRYREIVQVQLADGPPFALHDQAGGAPR
jgi:ATP-binding cassette subfamily B protein